MTIAILSWMLAMPLLGMMTGLRTMTPITVLCWFAYLHHLPIHHSWAFWLANPITVGVFTVLAIGEYIGDKLPQTPNRTAIGPLLARVAFGGLVGAIAATAIKGAAVEGIILGVLGALLGAFGGIHVRLCTVESTGRPDWNIAVVEDATAIILSVFAVLILTN